jgi:hypothetical protein
MFGVCVHKSQTIGRLCNVRVGRQKSEGAKRSCSCRGHKKDIAPFVSLLCRTHFPYPQGAICVSPQRRNVIIHIHQMMSQSKTTAVGGVLYLVVSFFSDATHEQKKCARPLSQKHSGSDFISSQKISSTSYFTTKNN